MTIDSQLSGYEALILRCWTDNAFKERFKEDPAACIREIGGALPEGVTISVHEDTPSVVHLVIPYASNELSDESLETVSGGLNLVDNKKLRLPEGFLGITPEMAFKGMGPGPMIGSSFSNK
jgi:hypothetical protein